MQLKAAIAASLQEVVKSDPNVNNHNITEVEDSDLETFDSDNEDNKDNKKQLTTTIVKSTIDEESCLSSGSLTKSPVTEPLEDYRLYLGPENGSKFELVVRYPDGNRENITFPSDSQLKVLLNLLEKW